MTRKEINTMGKLYESVVFVAKQQDLSSEPSPADKFHTQLKSVLGQTTNPDECGDPGDIELALSDLKKLHEYSKKLHSLIQNKQDVDGWMQSKITKAADYVSEVYHRLDSIESEGDMCCDEF
jgi:hypothetical protein